MSYILKLIFIIELLKLTDEDLDAQDEDISVSNVDVENSALTIVTGAKEKMELQARLKCSYFYSNLLH